MDKVLLRKFPKKIKDLRKLNGYTQDALSFRAKTGRSMLGNIDTA